MESKRAILAFSALAQATRLDVFRLLVAHEPRGLPAGEVARALGVPHNTMSTHLAVLTRAGLIAAERQSRLIVYRARLAAVRELAAFLMEDCCAAAPPDMAATDACGTGTSEGGTECCAPASARNRD